MHMVLVGSAQSFAQAVAMAIMLIKANALSGHYINAAAFT